MLILFINLKLLYLDVWLVYVFSSSDKEDKLELSQSNLVYLKFFFHVFYFKSDFNSRMGLTSKDYTYPNS